MTLSGHPLTHDVDVQFLKASPDDQNGGGKMSGHSKWKTIKHQKGAADAKRGLVFTKLARDITLAVRDGGGPDPSSNYRLRLIIDKAKSSNMPAETVDRAIKRGGGEGAHPRRGRGHTIGRAEGAHPGPREAATGRLQIPARSRVRRQFPADDDWQDRPQAASSAGAGAQDRPLGACRRISLRPG